MRRTLVLLAGLAASTAGCNSLTGAGDLELVDCIDCAPDSSTSPPDTTSPVDTTAEGSAADTSRDDTTASDTIDAAPEAGVDASDASDASDARDAADAADAADAPRICKGDLTCDDGNACTADRCVFGSCTSTVIDLDGDGEAPTTGACGPDCYDGNKAVFSKQTTYFTVAYTTAAGTVSFDYDCNGSDEPQYTTLGKCAPVSGKCTLTAGWSGTVVPSCGKSAQWLTGCTPYFTGACLPSAVTRVQSCR
ncbi:MAG: hypothetical protein HYV09_21190 [Deltaproteobacteria bacterium]|nr:hypothetical protein [Deltaproteobacteria bacterium]